MSPLIDKRTNSLFLISWTLDFVIKNGMQFRSKEMITWRNVKEKLYFFQ